MWQLSYCLGKLAVNTLKRVYKKLYVGKGNRSPFLGLIFSVSYYVYGNIFCCNLNRAKF